jgi:formate dehydrogenase maturation protein FdhE
MVDTVYLYLRCGMCGGDGIFKEVTCPQCDGTGKISLQFLDEVMNSFFTDINDRIDDILNKCNDIFEKLNET